MEKMAERTLEGYELKLDNPMLRRGFMMLEDGEFSEAKEQFDKVLDDAPECAEAYVGKLLAELELGDISLITTAKEPFEDKPAYRRAVKYADETLAEYLKECAIVMLERYEAGEREEKPEENPTKVAEVVDQNLRFSKKGKGYVVVGCHPDAYEATIPSTYSGLPVVGIAKKAFSVCEKLEKLVIPSSIKFIEDAFPELDENYNTPISEVYITDIEAWCNIEGLFYLMQHVERLFLFLNGKLITDLVIPDGTTTISANAFDSCTGLISVTIPNGVTSIGQSAFSSCTNLASITISNSVTSIGEYAFYNCESLASVTIPDSVTSIGQSAFVGCTGLKSVTIPNSVTSIGSWAFSGCTGLTSVTIPNSVTSIYDFAFYECVNLASITIPDSLTSIGGSAFEKCSSLKFIKLPNNATDIGYRAFGECKNLSVIIPSGFRRVGAWPFAGCNSLTIFYCGTKKEWKELGYTDDYTYFYSEKKKFLGGKQWHYVDGVPTKW